MSLSGKTFKLADGNSIPAIAYGVGTKWYKHGRNEIDEKVVEALQTAIKRGFVHIDGAEVYNTDKEVGLAVEGHRNNLFLTDKFFVGDSSHADKSQYGTPYESLKYHLEKELKTDHVDLYLLHSPFVKKEYHGFSLAEAWQSVEKLKDEGLAKSIGVSNFAVEDLEEILKVAKHKPVVNQIEFNAYLQNQTPGIPLGPITKGEPGEFTELLDTLGKKYNKTPGQVLLRWVLEKNILPVTTSSNPDRIRSFVEIFDFSLNKEEVLKLTEIGAKHKTLRQYWKKEYGKYD
ncbi:uncharacterized protein CXQ87_003665 [Candidozyma duobushaemuli]|uniref:NADP-dependent oxidoreductase domain-containing protein n=1 Tax=Candidozyma duobushaemuli TaxID=1231522 RepID=A0A2V1ACL5_9ASCO|nr:uncharacterized protein CXQ87_003665 [[Candida] duobushaemulonis]PVH15810.1 hypothetical protein CXQ87_003665 [[Candida] duobushaemulonis]